MDKRCFPAIAVVFGGGCAVSPDAALRNRCIAVMKQAFAVGTEEDFWARMHAAEGLTAAGQGQWVQSTLADMLEQSWNAQQLCGLCREMIRAGRDEYETAMIPILEQPQRGGATHAAESLFKVGRLGRRDRMEEAAADKDPVLAMMACAALVRAGDDRKLGRIRLGLSEQSERARSVACWVLGQIGDESDVERIRNAASTWDDGATFAADIALARLGEPAARERIFEWLDDPAETRVAAVCEALAAMRLPAARSHLMPLLDDDRIDVRVRAAHTLIMLLPGPDESVDPDQQAKRAES